MMKHSFLPHFLLAVILFAINAIFFGAATWGTIFAAGANAAGLMLGAGSGEYAALESQGMQLLSLIFTIIINIVLYYGLATIILFVFSLFSKKNKKE